LQSQLLRLEFSHDNRSSTVDVTVDTVTHDSLSSADCDITSTAADIDTWLSVDAVVLESAASSSLTKPFCAQGRLRTLQQ